MERKLYVKLLLWNANLAIHGSRLEVSQKYSKLWTLFLDFPLSSIGSPEVVVIWFFLLQLNFQFVKKSIQNWLCGDIWTRLATLRVMRLN